MCVFLDIAKTYDKTWRHGIPAAAHELSTRGALALFTRNLLYCRSFRTRVGLVCSDARESKMRVEMRVGLKAV